MRKDWLLFADIIVLLAVGLTTLYSTVIGTENAVGGGGIVNRQLVFVFLGLIIYFVVLNFDYKFLSNIQAVGFVAGLSILLLIAVLIFGPVINGARRWLLFGNFQLQASEFAKIAVIITTAWIATLRGKYPSGKLVLWSFIPTFIIALLVFVEPDAKTAIVIFVIWGFLVFTMLPNQLRNGLFVMQVVLGLVLMNLIGASAGTIIPVAVLLAVCVVGWLALNKKIGLMLVLPLLIGVGLGLGVRFGWGAAKYVLQDYQIERIEAFVNPGSDASGANFQVEQSKVAIGSGLLFGKGFGHGTQSKLKFLPEHQTDFIFAAFAEEFGVVGSVSLILLYAFAIFRIVRISSISHDFFGSMVCVGIAVKLLLEVFVNIGVNLGIMPATGIPLPLMSSGGSMMLATMIGLGLVQSVYKHREMIDTD